jgi:hypothetical protein
LMQADNSTTATDSNRCKIYVFLTRSNVL